MGGGSKEAFANLEFSLSFIERPSAGSIQIAADLGGDRLVVGVQSYVVLALLLNAKGQSCTYTSILKARGVDLLVRFPGGGRDAKLLTHMYNSPRAAAQW